MQKTTVHRIQSDCAKYFGITVVAVPSGMPRRKMRTISVTVRFVRRVLQHIGTSVLKVVVEAQPSRQPQGQEKDEADESRPKDQNKRRESLCANLISSMEQTVATE